MKKKRKKILWLLAICVLVVSLVGVTAYATNGANPINPAPEETIRDRSEDFDLWSYESHMAETGWNPLRALAPATWMNFFANAFFDLNKIIYSMFSLGITLFGQESVVNDYVVTFTEYSKAMYDTLYNSFGMTIIACMAIYVFYLAFVKSFQQALRQFCKFACVLIFAFAWNSNATTFIRWFDSISNEVQTALMAGLTDTTASNVTRSQNMLFELAIEEPYLLMNYGTANRGDVITIDNPDIINDLLFEGEPTAEKFETVAENVKEQAEDNIFLQPDKAGWKFVVAFLSPLMTILFGGPLLILQFLNLLTGIIALMLSSFVGLAMFLSLIPRFNRAIWKVMETLIGTFAVRVMLGIAFMMLMAVVRVIRGVIPTDGVANYLLQVLAIAVTVFAIWKYRDKIIYMVTGGVIASVDNGLWKHATNPIKNESKKTAKTGADVATTATTGVPASSLTNGEDETATKRPNDDFQKTPDDEEKPDEKSEQTPTDEVSTENENDQDQVTLDTEADDNSEDANLDTGEEETETDDLPGNDLQMSDGSEDEEENLSDELPSDQLVLSDEEETEDEELLIEPSDLVVLEGDEDLEDVDFDPVILTDEENGQGDDVEFETDGLISESSDFPENSAEESIVAVEELQTTEEREIDHHEIEDNELTITVNGAPVSHDATTVEVDHEVDFVSNVETNQLVDSPITSNPTISAEQQAALSDQLEQARGE